MAASKNATIAPNPKNNPDGALPLDYAPSPLLREFTFAAVEHHKAWRKGLHKNLQNCAR